MPRPQHARDNDPTDLSHQQTSAEPAARVKSSKKPVEYGDHSSTYWAPGWNYQRFSTASLDDIRSIPEDELEKMQAGMREALGEEGVVKWNLDLYEQEQKAAGQDTVPDLAEEAFAAPEARPKSSRRKVEYGDDSSTYWAPGWDYERFSKATAEDIASVPEDEMEKMRAGMREALGEDGFDKWSCFMFEQEQKATGQVPVITQQRPPAYVERYEKAYKGTKWGFVAFRTACYDDEKRWQQFMAKWNAILKLPFQCHEGRPGVAEAKADCEVHWVQDVQLAGASVDELRE